jgi:hypothetical protein
VIAHARRRTELGLIVLGAIVTVGAYALASLGRTANLPANIGPFLGVVLGLVIAAHLATRRLAPGGDALLLPLAALLNGIGYVFIARLDEASRDPDGLAGLQAAWTALGIVAYVLTLLVVRRSRDLARYRYTFRSSASCCCSCRSSRSSATRCAARGSGCRSDPSGSSRGSSPRSPSPSSSPATSRSGASS